PRTASATASDHRAQAAATPHRSVLLAVRLLHRSTQVLALRGGKADRSGALPAGLSARLADAVRRPAQPHHTLHHRAGDHAGERGRAPRRSRGRNATPSRGSGGPFRRTETGARPYQAGTIPASIASTDERRRVRNARIDRR